MLGYCDTIVPVYINSVYINSHGKLWISMTVEFCDQVLLLTASTMAVVFSVQSLAWGEQKGRMVHLTPEAGRWAKRGVGAKCWGSMEIKPSSFYTETVKLMRKIKVIGKEITRDHQGEAAEGQQQIIHTHEKQTTFCPRRAVSSTASLQ